MNDYYIPGTSQCFTCIISFNHHQDLTYEVGKIITPILQMKKWRHRDVTRCFEIGSEDKKEFLEIKMG